MKTLVQADTLPDQRVREELLEEGIMPRAIVWLLDSASSKPISRYSKGRGAVGLPVFDMAIQDAEESLEHYVSFRARKILRLHIPEHALAIPTPFYESEIVPIRSFEINKGFPNAKEAIYYPVFGEVALTGSKYNIRPASLDEMLSSMTTHDPRASDEDTELVDEFLADLTIDMAVVANEVLSYGS